jgi:DNA-binding NtrC family response regulator
MNIDIWIKDRSTKGTLANMARRILASDRAYRATELRLRQMYVFEALLQNDGNHERTAEKLGLHRNTIGRTLKALGIASTDVREIAKALRGGTHGN